MFIAIKWSNGEHTDLYIILIQKSTPHYSLGDYIFHTIFIFCCIVLNQDVRSYGHPVETGQF